MAAGQGRDYQPAAHCQVRFSSYNAIPPIPDFAFGAPAHHFIRVTASCALSRPKYGTFLSRSKLALVMIITSELLRAGRSACNLRDRLDNAKAKSQACAPRAGGQHDVRAVTLRAG